MGNSCLTMQGGYPSHDDDSASRKHILSLCRPELAEGRFISSGGEPRESDRGFLVTLRRQPGYLGTSGR